MIPIYRAKQTYGGKYVKGNLRTFGVECRIYEFDGTEHIVNGKTLSIHFPVMLDKNDKPIFAALNTNKVGGDKIRYVDVLGGLNYETACIDECGDFYGIGVELYQRTCEVAGIYEGEQS